MNTTDTIIRDAAGHLFRVTEPRDAGLAHCWIGTPVRRTKDGYADKRTSKAGHSRLIRKLGCTVVEG